MSEKRIEKLETQRHRATITYMVKNCGGTGLPFLPTAQGGWGAGASLPCFPFHDGRGGSARHWIVALPISCWCELSPLRLRRSWQVRCKVSLHRWRRWSVSWRRPRRAEGAVERTEGGQSGARDGEGSRRAAVLEHGRDAGHRAGSHHGE
jgi:hypothetical protein